MSVWVLGHSPTTCQPVTLAIPFSLIYEIQGRKNSRYLCLEASVADPDPNPNLDPSFLAGSGSGSGSKNILKKGVYQVGNYSCISSYREFNLILHFSDKLN